MEYILIEDIKISIKPVEVSPGNGIPKTPGNYSFTFPAFQRKVQVTIEGVKWIHKLAIYSV